MKYDVIIIGTGVAGLYTATKINKDLKVALMTKDLLDKSNSMLAQGGIAAAISDDDSWKEHFDDTLVAGAGLCDQEVVEILTKSAKDTILDLEKLGIVFNKKGNKLALGREGAHGKNRIVHFEDQTGAAVCTRLQEIVSEKKNVDIYENICIRDIVIEDNQAKGVIGYSFDKEEYLSFASENIVVCSGGYSNLYRTSSNNAQSTGDMAALLHSKGVKLTDMEFVQFHPTVLSMEQNHSFLISEAVRGEGAILRNEKGEAFMAKYHPQKDLAPRDVVARAIFDQMRKYDEDHVELDITFKNKEWLEKRFPKIYNVCYEYGIDMSKDCIPIAPAAHYCMGGVKVDTNGRTSVNGLFACGEVACTGVHGANRLASNSLLEALVFANRIANQCKRCDNLDEIGLKKALASFNQKVVLNTSEIAKLKTNIKIIMSKYVGIIRNDEDLNKAHKKLEEVQDKLKAFDYECLNKWEALNMTQIGLLIIESAINRKESRGAHYRKDYPKTREEYKKRFTV